MPEQQRSSYQMAKVFTIPVRPDVSRVRKPRSSDTRYIEGQRLIVEAMRYLAKEGPDRNREAIELLSEHFRTRFRMSDRPSQ
jgi:hypothetical protein